MGRDTNRVSLKGTVAATPESRSKPNGDRTVTLRVSTVDRVQRNGETAEFTNWHRVVCFAAAADTAANLRENDRVSIEGKLQTRKYEVDGKVSYITEVIAFDVDKLASDATVCGSPMPGRAPTSPLRNGGTPNAPEDPWRDDGRPF